MSNSGKLIDINTGQVLATVPDPEVAFSVYIDQTRQRLGTDNHLRYGRCRMRKARRFIDEMRDKGIECVPDPRLPADSCILVDGTNDDWIKEGLSP